MLCDGRVVCGCADPYAKRVLGDARDDARSATIWTGETASALRRDLNAGGSTFCGDCPLKLPLADDEPPRVRPLARRRRRRHAVPPPALRRDARRPATSRASTPAARPRPASRKTRQAGMLDVGAVRARPRRARPDARPHRLLQLRRSLPAQEGGRDVRAGQDAAIRTSISTRAPTAAPSPRTRVRQLVRSGIDEMTFSLDGASQDATCATGSAADFEKSTAILRAAIDEKRRLGRDVPVINWRYILFNWNDNDREMAAGAARSPPSAASIACAGRSPITPSTPTRAGSRRARPSTRRSATRSGTTTTSGTRSPARCRGRGSRCAAAGPDAPLGGRRRRDGPLDTRVRNLSQRPFPATATYGRRLVRLGAQLATADGALDRPRLGARLAAATIPPGRPRRRRHRRAGAARARAATRCDSTWSAKASTGSRPAARSPPSASSSSTDRAGRAVYRRVIRNTQSGPPFTQRPSTTVPDASIVPVSVKSVLLQKKLSSEMTMSRGCETCPSMVR